MIFCGDQERASIIATFGRLASLEAAQQLLESAIKNSDSDLVVHASQLLASALRGTVLDVGSQAEGDRSFFADLMPSYLKTVKTVLAKGVPTRVQLKECKITDCVTCFYENICERISIEKLIAKNRDLVHSLTEER